MPVLLEARRPEHGDVTKIPTPPLQAAAVFINFFLPAIALIIVFLRAYSRVTSNQLGLDDYLIFVAMVFSLLMIGPFYIYIKLNYFGWHKVDVPPFDPSPGLWWFYIAQLFYNPVLAFVKASVLVFLLRLGGHRRGIRYTIYGVNLFNALQGVAIFLVATLQCLPIEANWDSQVKKTATCVHPSFHVSISSITLFTDIVVLAIPFWIFLSLKMPRAAKIALIGVFLIGLSVIVIGVVRLYQIEQLFFGAPREDPFYDIGIVLSVVEVNLAIISASGPALRGLFRRWFPNMIGGTSQYPYANSGNRYASQKHSGNRSGNRGSSTIGNYLGRGTFGAAAFYEDNSRGGGGNGIALSPIRGGSRSHHTEIRNASPTDSEEEIMTYNGIMRSTDVRIQYTTRKGSIIEEEEMGRPEKSETSFDLPIAR